MDSAFFIENKDLEPCKDQMFHAKEALIRCVKEGHTIILGGIGESIGDCESIDTELRRSFEIQRALTKEEVESLQDLPFGRLLSNKLERSLPVICLGLNEIFNSSICKSSNDPRVTLAQDLLGISRENDLLWLLTSETPNEPLLMAASIGKMKGMRILGLTGNNPDFASMCDVLIEAPGETKSKIRENQIKIYHALTREVEADLF